MQAVCVSCWQQCTFPPSRQQTPVERTRISRLRLELCLEPCLLTSGPRAAGFRFLIYATELYHIYVYRKVIIFFFCFYFSFSDRWYSFITDIFIYLILLLMLESTKRVGRERGFWRSFVTSFREWGEEALADYKFFEGLTSSSLNHFISHSA